MTQILDKYNNYENKLIDTCVFNHLIIIFIIISSKTCVYIETRLVVDGVVCCHVTSAHWFQIWSRLNLCFRDRVTGQLSSKENETSSGTVLLNVLFLLNKFHCHEQRCNKFDHLDCFRYMDNCMKGQFPVLRIKGPSSCNKNSVTCQCSI